MAASLFLHWPVWIGIAVVVAAAVQNHFTNRVSNLITLGAIAAGWLAAHLLSARDGGPVVEGNLVSSLLCTLAVFGLLVPFYAMDLAPAGSIKAQMGLGAWIGCALPLGSAIVLTVSATIAGGIMTAIGVYFYYRKQLAALDADALGLEGPSRLFPFQLTLSLGSLCGMIAATWLRFV